MTTIQVEDEIVRRLKRIAEHEQRQVDELVNEVLEQFTQVHAEHAAQSEEIGDTQHDPDDVLLRVLEGADKLGHSSLEGNISERSREILANPGH
jgi:hypothetical protein